jgi:hypothetical protein
MGIEESGVLLIIHPVRVMRIASSGVILMNQMIKR